MGRARWAVFAVMAVVLAACASPAAVRSGDGDCVVTIRFRGAVYRPVGAFRIPRPGRSLGSSDRYGCAGKPIPGNARMLQLHAAVGLDPEVAVLAQERGHETGVYVRSMKERDWPAKLKETRQIARCRVPASFVGTWKTPELGDSDRPTVPYSGLFLARQGTGLQLDQWSTVWLEARITEATRPVPTAQFVRRAVVGKAQVAVTTVCRGTAFEVSSIKLAD